MEALYKYKNGNYYVKLYEDGTKIRMAPEDTFNAEFPENIDIKITNYCTMNCPMCHENSSTDGNHASLLSIPFIDTLVPGTELAIGGGMVTSHPQLIPFLKLLKAKGIVPNITLHQYELLNNKELIQLLIDDKLVYGVGVSIHCYDEQTVEFAKKNKNVVFHTIVGYTPIELFEQLADKGLKILMLGYKDFRRGIAYKREHTDYISKEQTLLVKKLPELMKRFSVVSFDNLALTQLDVKSMLSDKQWDEFYMGDDGKYTMYVDLVTQTFAKNSTYPVEDRLPLESNIIDMFTKVKNM